LPLSGTLYTNVGSHWRLSISWSATQSIDNNSSTVTAKMYWEALDGYGAVSSSTVKDGAININGSVFPFSGAGLASLSGNQKKLLATRSKTIDHNSVGEGAFYINGYFDADIDLSGTHYNRINIWTESYDLPTIPRMSTMTSSASLTAGLNRTIDISRASSSFSHIVNIDVQTRSGTWEFLKGISFSSAEISKSTSFTTAQIKKIFDVLDGRTSGSIRWNVNTYNGDTHIGYRTYTGTVSAPASSTVDSINGEANRENDVYIDQTIDIGLKRSNSAFSHTVEITLGSYKRTFTSVSTSLSWLPTASEQASLYGQMGNLRSKAGNIRVYTYYEGELVGSYTDKTLNFYIRASTNQPEFSGTGITYKDTNSISVGVTGNDQYIVQGISTLQVTIPVTAKAIGKNGATIKEYAVTVNGDTRTVAYSDTADVVVDFGVVYAATGTSITVKATDSRGFATSVTVPLNMVPYSEPVITASAKRANGFEAATTIKLQGVLSTLMVNSEAKNSIVTARYRYKDAAVTTWSGWAYFTIAGFPTYSAQDVVLDLDTEATWDIQIDVEDKLTTTTRYLSVGVGRPIMFIDPDKKSIGVGDFPQEPNSMEIAGNRYPVLAWRDTVGQKFFLTMFDETLSFRFGVNDAAHEIAKISTAEFATLGKTFLRNDGGILKLIGKTHVFQEFFPLGEAEGRHGYFGYGAPQAPTTMFLKSEKGSLNIEAPTGIINISGGAVNVQQTGWVDATLYTPWRNYDAAGAVYSKVQYRKTSHNTVRLRGLITGESAESTTTMFALPSGFRPPKEMIFNQKNKGGEGVSSTARIGIFPSTGAVRYSGAADSYRNVDWISLDGIEFDIT
jgi:hypothetical protein